MIKEMILSIFLITLASSAQASMGDQLAGFISDEVYSMDNAFVKHAESNPNTVDENWMLRRFWLRLRARFGIEVPGLAEFDVIPEVEMLWENQVPDEYEIYKP